VVVINKDVEGVKAQEINADALDKFKNPEVNVSISIPIAG
jgi:hypothetical protein